MEVNGDRNWNYFREFDIGNLVLHIPLKRWYMIVCRGNEIFEYISRERSQWNDGGRELRLF